MNETPEKWVPVVGFVGLYEVSDCGRVRTLHKVGRACRNGILEQTANKKGYLRVGLTIGGERKARLVHNLVVEAFIGPRPSPDHECNHKDGVKTNNLVGNLEWLTRIQNNAHARAMGLWQPHRGEAHGRAILTEENVRTIRSLQGVERSGTLARRYGVCVDMIRRVWKREAWKHVV